MHGYPCVCVHPFYTHCAMRVGYLCSTSHVIETALTKQDRVLALLLNKHIPVCPHQKISMLAEKIRERINHLALWLYFPTGRSPVEICSVRIHSCCYSLLWFDKLYYMSAMKAKGLKSDLGGALFFNVYFERRVSIEIWPKVPQCLCPV